MDSHPLPACKSYRQSIGVSSAVLPAGRTHVPFCAPTRAHASLQLQAPAPGSFSSSCRLPCLELRGLRVKTVTTALHSFQRAFECAPALEHVQVKHKAHGEGKRTSQDLTLRLKAPLRPPQTTPALCFHSFWAYGTTQRAMNPERPQRASVFDALDAYLVSGFFL